MGTTFRSGKVAVQVVQLSLLISLALLIARAPAVAQDDTDPHVRGFTTLIDAGSFNDSDFVSLRIGQLALHRISLKDDSSYQTLLGARVPSLDKDVGRLFKSIPADLKKFEMAQHVFPCEVEIDILVRAASFGEDERAAGQLSLLVYSLLWPGTVDQRYDDIQLLNRLARILAVNSRDRGSLADGKGWQLVARMGACLGTSTYEWFRWRDLVVPELLAADYDNPAWLITESPLRKASTDLIGKWRTATLAYWQERTDPPNKADDDNDRAVAACEHLVAMDNLNGLKRPELLSSMLQPRPHPFPNEIGSFQHYKLNAPPLIYHPVLTIVAEDAATNWQLEQALTSPIIAVHLQQQVNVKDYVAQMRRAALISPKVFRNDPQVRELKNASKYGLSEAAVDRWCDAITRNYFLVSRPSTGEEGQDVGDRYYESRFYPNPDVDHDASADTAFLAYYAELKQRFEEEPATALGSEDTLFLDSPHIGDSFARAIATGKVSPGDAAAQRLRLHYTGRVTPAYPLAEIARWQRGKDAVSELEQWGRLDFLSAFEGHDSGKPSPWEEAPPHLRDAYYATQRLSPESGTFLNRATWERNFPQLLPFQRRAAIASSAYMAGQYYEVLTHRNAAVGWFKQADAARDDRQWASMLALPANVGEPYAAHIEEAEKALRAEEKPQQPLSAYPLLLAVNQLAHYFVYRHAMGPALFPAVWNSDIGKPENGQALDLEALAPHALDEYSRQFIENPAKVIGTFVTVPGGPFTRAMLTLLSIRVHELLQLSQLGIGNLANGDLETAWQEGISIASQVNADDRRGLPTLGIFEQRQQPNDRGDMTFAEQLIWKHVVWVAALYETIRSHLALQHGETVEGSATLLALKRVRSTLNDNGQWRLWQNDGGAANPANNRTNAEALPSVQRRLHEAIRQYRSDEKHRQLLAAVHMQLQLVLLPAADYHEATKAELEAARHRAIERKFELEAARFESTASNELTLAAQAAYSGALARIEVKEFEVRAREIAVAITQVEEFRVELRRQHNHRNSDLVKKGLAAAEKLHKLQLDEVVCKLAQLQVARQIVVGTVDSPAVIEVLINQATVQAEELERDLQRRQEELQAQVIAEAAAGFFKSLLSFVGGIVGTFFGMPSLGVQVGGLVGGVVSGIIRGESFEHIALGALHGGMGIAQSMGFSWKDIAASAGEKLGNIIPDELSVTAGEVADWFNKELLIPLRHHAAELGSQIETLQMALKGLHDHIKVQAIETFAGARTAVQAYCQTRLDEGRGWADEIGEALGLPDNLKNDAQKLANVLLSTVPQSEMLKVVEDSYNRELDRWKGRAEGEFVTVETFLKQRDEVERIIKNHFPSAGKEELASREELTTRLAFVMNQVVEDNVPKGLRDALQKWQTDFENLMSDVANAASAPARDTAEALNNVTTARTQLEQTVIHDFLPNSRSGLESALSEEEGELRKRERELHEATMQWVEWKLRANDLFIEQDDRELVGEVLRLTQELQDAELEATRAALVGAQFNAESKAHDQRASSLRARAGEARVAAAESAYERELALVRAAEHRLSAARDIDRFRHTVVHVMQGNDQHWDFQVVNGRLIAFLMQRGENLRQVRLQGINPLLHAREKTWPTATELTALSWRFPPGPEGEMKSLLVEPAARD